MSQNVHKAGGIIVVLFAIAIAMLVLWPMFLDPGHIIPQLGADGGKNAFVYLYQVLYGRGIWSYAMNYPYGNHIVFTDGQPLLSVILNRVGSVSIAHALTVMWRLVALSFILSIVFVYKILVRLRVSTLLSLIGSGLICIMSPQLFRIQGHYSLSYAFVIPMLYYWTLRYHEKRHWRFPVYIFMLGLTTTLLHPYYAGIALVWVVFYVIGYCYLHRGNLKSSLFHVIPLLVSVAAVFLVFGGMMYFSDPIKDRPVTPYGTLNYCVTGNQILTSAYSPVWRFIQNHTPFKDVCEGAEGFSYIGLVSIVIVVMSVYFGIRNWRKKVASSYVGIDKTYHPVWLFLAAFALLLSMGVPFVWNMEWLLDYLSYLRQFRTLGRFIWLFYYLITIYSVVVLHNWWLTMIEANKKVIAYLIVAAAVGIWSLECKGYVEYQRRKLSECYGNYDKIMGLDGHDWRRFLEERCFKADDFQAIITLRYYNIGTEKLWLGDDSYSWGVAYGAEAGLQLHLPLVNSSLSRSSWSLAEKQVKTIAGICVHKPMFDDLKSEKPFLLLHVGPNLLDPDEAYLLSCANKIGTFRQCDVYACYPQRIREMDIHYHDSIAKIAFVFNGRDTCLETKGVWYVNHFDKGTSVEKFFGPGAEIARFHHDSIIATCPITPVYDNQLYEFSCWFLLSEKNYRSPNIKIEMMDKEGNLTKEQWVLTKESRDNKGLWFRANSWFTVPKQCTHIRFRMASDYAADYMAVDELLLRPSDAIIISKNANGAWLVNNHLQL